MFKIENYVTVVPETHLFIIMFHGNGANSAMAELPFLFHVGLRRNQQLAPFCIINIVACNVELRARRQRVSKSL